MSELSSQLKSAMPEISGVGPEWLRSLRDKGAEDFYIHGLPTRKDEAWKYTGLATLTQDEIKLAVDFVAPESCVTHPSPLVETDLQINMLDGQLLTKIGAQRAGLTVLPLADALKSGQVELQALLESLGGPNPKTGSTEGLIALNSATLNPGLVIHVAAATDAGRLSLVWSTRKGESPQLFNSRVCVILEQGAKLELLEQFESPDVNTNSSNVVFQAELAAGSILNHVRFQQESDETTLITRTEVSQQADSNYAYFGFDLGGGLVRHDLHASLAGSGASSAINGAYLLDGKRHVDNHARVDHLAPGGFSDQYFRGVAGGSSRAVFNTAVCVHPGADETEARQSNGNILLSARAEVDTKPELEIYADEVVASHGATVGQLDEQAVFYLRSRGLTEHDARQMLTTAFCRSVSDKLDDQALADVISERMMAVMPKAQ